MGSVGTVGGGALVASNISEPGLGRGQVAVAQGETSLALHSSSLEPMTPRDRVLLSECCFISPNFSLLFRIITNKKSIPVRWKRGLVVRTLAHIAPAALQQTQK